MLSVAPDRAMEPGGGLERELALAAGTNEAGKRCRVGTDAPPQRTFALQPELRELIEPVVEPSSSGTST